MPSKLWLLLTGILILPAFSVGCGSARAPQIDDAAITAAIKAKIASDGDINPFNIDVDTNEGVVTLHGRVAQERARIRIEELARDTDGVKMVINLVKADTGGGGDPCYAPKCSCKDGTCKESCC